VPPEQASHGEPADPGQVPAAQAGDENGVQVGTQEKRELERCAQYTASAVVPAPAIPPIALITTVPGVFRSAWSSAAVSACSRISASWGTARSTSVSDSTSASGSSRHKDSAARVWTATWSHDASRAADPNSISNRDTSSSPSSTLIRYPEGCVLIRVRLASPSAARSRLT
jgi:hypothetical protein